MQMLWYVSVKCHQKWLRQKVALYCTLLKRWKIHLFKQKQHLLLNCALCDSVGAAAQKSQQLVGKDVRSEAAENSLV